MPQNKSNQADKTSFISFIFIGLVLYLTLTNGFYMLPVGVPERIENRFGSSILYSKECEALSKSIENTCSVRISITTLKRLFGFVKRIDKPRICTCNVLASYIGFKDWKSLLADIDKAKRVAVPPVPSYIRNEVSLNNGHLLHHQMSIFITT